jgi:hypothetical protein
MRSLHSFPLIEPLESRIAPAMIILGVGTSLNNPLLYSAKSIVNPKTGQPYLQFFNAGSSSLSGTNLAIAKTVGENSEVYFIKVSAGEAVEIPTSVGYQDMVNVTQGTVVAFFTDFNSDGVVNSNELTGLALGTKTSVAIGTAVNGDVVTNYNDVTGALGGASEAAGSATNLLPNVVLNLAVAGPITGAFIAGGPVSRFSATGNVTEILTGTAANGYTFSFEGVANMTGNTTLNVPTPAAKIAGPSISNVLIGSTNLISLGSGGAGAAGGSISNLTLLNAATGFTVQAGAGGMGVAGRTAGGAGGAINTVIVNGPLASTPTTPNSPIILIGGAGGYGLGSARGGAGGAVTNVFVDYKTANTNNPSLSTLPDNVTVQGGAGGSGGDAGAGGSLNNINVITTTPHDLTSNAAEFQLLGGVGGASTAGGKGGAGGAVNNAQVFDLALPVADSPGALPDDTVATSPTNVITLIEGGAGGAAAVKGAGGAGGSVSNLTLKGFNFDIQSGAGGLGISSGGAGGGISAVTVLGSSGALPGDNFHDESLIIMTGAGGAGSEGKGGAGGSLTTLTVENADFGATGLQIATGNGGQAGKGAGGAGGGISNLRITDADFLTLSHPLGNTGNVTITTGDGGSAPIAGGKGGPGGAMSNVTIVGTRLAIPNVSTGTGGAGGVSGSAAGKGGAGGAMTSVSIRTAEDLEVSTTTASTGLLSDSNAFFTDFVQVGDTVENSLTLATTTVTDVLSDTELALASDIFAAGDPYLVDGSEGGFAVGVTGTAMDSQDTIIDTTVNFVAEGIVPGEVVEDITDTGNNNGVPVTTVVTGVMPNELTVTSDISHVGDQYGFPGLSLANFASGAGGSGALSGAGGAGGAIVNSSVVAPGTITFVGGAGGGGGATAAAGAGGSLTNDGAFSNFGSGMLTAGNAGATGAKAGAGGSVIGADIQALTNVSMIGGNGAAGGAGGGVNASGFSGVLQEGGGFNPPSGNITVQAGAGGASAVGNGGAGGSISTLTGFISTGDGGDPFTTQFDAGAGGNGVAKAGAGGSVSNVRFFGGGGAGVTFFINAGDAGNASTGKTGATGGSVTNIGGGAFTSGSSDPNFSISTLTNFHHISAGDGGNAAGTGGLGGSVSNVHVNAAIGVRTGVPFGFDLAGAGGISAGAGGTGATTGHAGNVTNISADAIASIVAGHLDVGAALQKANLVTEVTGIILNGDVAPSTVQQFELSFDGSTTGLLPTNATPNEVASALNAIIDPIQFAAGIPVGEEGVTAKSTGTGYTLTYVDNGAQVNALTGSEPAPVYTTELTQGNYVTNTPEVQNVQVFGLDPFTLTFEGETTTQLAANATPGDVAAALENLPNIGPGGVSVAAGTGTTNPSYTITFAFAGPQQLIVPNFSLGVQTVAGTSTTAEVDTLTFPTRGDINPTLLSTANFVGSIVNPLRPNATVFSFTPLVSGSSFQFGDAPIDGLIAAVTLTGYKNFVPEAFVTESSGGSAVLIDNVTS